MRAKVCHIFNLLSMIKSHTKTFNGTKSTQISPKYF